LHGVKMTMIDGFDIEPYIDDTFLFRRVCEPQHEYVVKITSERIEVSETLPADVDCEDPGVDAVSRKGDVLKAAKQYKVRLFPK
jgi:hypothetical protein